jgi:hypothetical protein
LRARLLFVPIGAAVLASCTLITSLDGLRGEETSDAAPERDAAQEDGGRDAAEEQVYASCSAAKAARPNAGDGFYLIESGDAGAPRRAWCDMTQDQGGWMLVTRDMILRERSRSVTVLEEDDARGGLVVRVFANAPGCGTPPDNVYLVTFSEQPRWTQIRAKYVFAGSTSCWWIFGRVNAEPPGQIDGEVIDPYVFAFDPAADTIRDQVRMGGDAGATFDGKTYRCDNEANNFWQGDLGLETRSAVVILRRNMLGPAGLATTTSCTDNGLSTSSPTWWEYRDIYVR